MKSLVMRLLGRDRDDHLDNVLRLIAGSANTDEALLPAVLRARGLGELVDGRGDFVVAGILDREGDVAGIEVYVAEVRLDRDPAPLAKTTTNPHGEFCLRLDSKEATVVRVFARHERERWVTPPRRLEKEMWVEWSRAGGQPAARPGAFELREALLQRVVTDAGLRLEDLDETPDRLQVSLVAETVGVSRGHVALHGLCARLEKKVGVPRAALYAVLGRLLDDHPSAPPTLGTGVAPVVDDDLRSAIDRLRREALAGSAVSRLEQLAEQILIATDGDTLRAALDHAVGGGLVSARARRGADLIVARVEEARLQMALARRPGARRSWTDWFAERPDARSGWGALLELCGVPTMRFAEAARLILSRPDGPDLRTELAALAPESRRGAVRDALDLAAILDHDLVSTAVFVKEGLASTRALAGLSHDALERHATAAFAHERATAGVRAARLVESIDRAHPSIALLRYRGARLTQRTQDVLRRDALLGLNVERAHRERRLGDVATAPVTRDELLTLQRVARLTGHARLTDRLVERGFTSAAKIAFTDRAEFLRACAGDASEDELVRLHRRARRHYRATLALFLRHNRQANGPTLRTLNLTTDIPDADIAGAPSWELLFGSPDYCDCEDCSSVTSPAAYLVDLLLWLGRAPQAAAAPLDVLTRRRPDLTKILLDCANTKTEVPYIDLVCELLEDEVALRTFPVLRNGRVQIESSAGPWALAGDPHLILRIDGGAAQDVVCAAAAFAQPSVATPAEVAAVLNAALVGARAVVVGNGVVVESTGPAPGAVEIIGGAAATALGMSVGAAREGAADARRRRRQTRLTAAEIRAYPEHLDPWVYESLRGFTDKMVSPLDLPTAEMRSYLSLEVSPKPGVTRLELLELFGRASDAERAAEHFALARAEWDLLGTASPTDPAQRAQWGFVGPQIPLEDYLRIAPSPRGSTSVFEHRELRALLACRFPNPGGAVVERLEAPGDVDLCRATDRELAGVTLDALDRQHRFLRLARRVPWTFAGLDLLLRSSGGAALDEAALIRLAQIDRAGRRMGLGAEELTSLFADFSLADVLATVDGRPSLYARTFLVRADGSPPAFLRDPALAPTTLADAGPALCGALGLAAEDLATIIAATGLAGDVTFATLSTLHRHAALARATRLPVGLFELLRAVVDPFADSAALLRFLDVADVVRGFDEADLRALTTAAVVIPDSAPLVVAMNGVKQTTAARLEEENGVAPAAAEVEQDIAATGSWTAPVCAWLELDTRFAALLAAVDDGAVAAGLCAAVPVVATLALLARVPSMVRVLDAKAERATVVAGLPGVVATIRAPSMVSLQQALWWRRALDTAADPTGWSTLFTAAAGAPRADIAAAVARALGADVADIAEFWDLSFGAGGLDRAAILSADHQARLTGCLALGRRLGASVALMSSWAVAWPAAAEAASLRNTVRSRLTNDEWLKTSTRVQDVLREQRRDALVAYLLATAGPGQPRTTPELSGHLLIDVEMDDCMTTSRLVQASAAIQSFVQRCFSGQEAVDEAALASDHWKEWDWRERYRLWEANRMVFLYPENFLDVARRSNASPLFRDFMKEVRQSERDDESVRAALESYLAGLENIANLDQAALATNLTEAGATKSLQLVARSRSTPPRHYHRSLSAGVWTPWEALEIGTPGRHLALAHHHGKTTILWPTFAEHPDPRQLVPGTPAPPLTDHPAEEAPPPRGVTYLSYGWAIRDRKKWSTVETSARALLHQKRARTGMVTAPGPLLQSAGTRIGVFAQNPPQNTAEQPNNSVIPQLGWLELERDITSITVHPDRRALSAWLGGDHQPHIDSTTTLAPYVCDLGPGCRCVFFLETYLTPWTGLVFQDNRMVSQLATTRLSIALEGSVGRTTIPVLDGRSFAVAPDMATPRLISPGFSMGGGFESFNFVLGGSVFDFGVDAFAVTDAHRSFLALRPGAVEQLAEGAPQPSGTQLLLVPAYHPFASELRELVRTRDDALERVFTATVQENPGTLGRPPLAFGAAYGNHPQIAFTAASEALEFGGISPYALYNWELFFHAPLYVAEQLRVARRYEEARRYYQFIFRPLSTEPVDPARPQARYWVTKPLREDQGVNADIRTILLQGAVQLRNPFNGIEAYPFDAQRIAQARPSAYQKHVVMRYLDNLIAWGDQLFRSGERESTMEAIQYYELARTILGPTPQKLQPLGERRSRAFDDADWRGGANALVELENLIADAGDGDEDDTPLVELPVVRGLYFCVPPNQRLLRYWSEVDRRLYNLRHCLSLDGQPVRYELLSAPIDPQALVDAAAAGVSVADALAAANAPLPPHRFRVMWARAMEACAEVKALGSALQAALEKRDAEALAGLRSAWEGKVIERTAQTRQKQREQAQAELDALSGSRALIEGRLSYYTSREYMNDLEKTAVGLVTTAAGLDLTGLVFDVLGGVLYLIPNIDLGVSGFGGTPKAGVQTGGDNIGNSTARTSQGISRLAGLFDRAGGLVGTQAGYVRRKDDWDHQASQAKLELEHLQRQIAAARLRVAIADAEIAGHQTQRNGWEDTDARLREKFTNEDLFDWTVGVLAELYREAFGLAVRLAKMARACLLYELPARATANVGPVGDGLWTSLRHGLLAGERLTSELRAIDEVFATERPHHREVLQHVALSQVDPRALVTLRRAGGCRFRIPRWWWQRFDPMLSQRRVKRVSVTVPSVTGPYTALNATLRCAQATRVVGSISLSRGANDFGCDVATAADRYLPFEGTSLEQDTVWDFGFPADPNNVGRVLTDVDFATIADVVLHVEYVADEGGPAVIDAPPVLETLVDVRAMDADAWSALVLTPAHTCRVVVRDLVPRLLSGRPATAVVSTVALLDDESDVAAALTVTLGAGADAGTLSIAPAVGAAFDWRRLQRVFVGLRF